jgi:myosin heavy subunit
MAKTLYEKLWNHLLFIMNKLISEDEGEVKEVEEGHYSIGVLDIFGFENFPVRFIFNSFFLIKKKKKIKDKTK